MIDILRFDFLLEVTFFNVVVLLQSCSLSCICLTPVNQLAAVIVQRDVRNQQICWTTDKTTDTVHKSRDIWLRSIRGVLCVQTVLQNKLDFSKM